MLQNGVQNIGRKTYYYDSINGDLAVWVLGDVIDPIKCIKIFELDCLFEKKVDIELNLSIWCMTMNGQRLMSTYKKTYFVTKA